jgi:hypothetical protein
VSKYSSDEDVENMVLQIEADYVAAQEALRDGSGSVEAYKEAKNNYFAARQASRAGRGMAITAE